MSEPGLCLFGMTSDRFTTAAIWQPDSEHRTQQLE